MKRILLFIVCFVSALYAGAQIKEFTLPDGKVIKVDTKVFPNFQPNAASAPQPAEYAARRKARAKQGRVKLPEYVYNGESKFFPPIFNQDGGSCGSAQSIAYMFTYEMASYRDLDASLPENQYPSHFTWLLSYQSRGNVDMAKEIGIPNVPTYGGRTYSKLFGPQDCNDPDYGWMQGYDKWYSAMWNRNSHDVTFAPTTTPEGRQELKEWLYNHCGDTDMHGGGLAGIGVAAGPYSGSIPNTPANTAAGVNGMRYVTAWGETYNHAVTVCGYDDRIEFDLDGDGIIGEVEEDEVGAWIIANSWGSGWENKGFIYCPYKYSYSVGKDTYPWAPNAHVINKNYRPLRTIKLLMDYSHRSELFFCAGVSEDLNATKPDVTISLAHFLNGGYTNGNNPAPEVPMLGRWVDGMHYEPMEFGYDLTSLTSAVDRTKPLKYFFIVQTPSNAIGSGHIYEASIINYEVENDGVEIPFDDKNVEIVSSNRETIISVIVPGEQLYPPYNLSLQNRTLTWSAPQKSGLKLTGYNVYDGNKLIAQLSAEQTEYTLEGEATDPLTVKAVYETGAYKQESDPSNCTAQQTPNNENNRLAMLDKGGITIPNAIPNVLTKATIEFWMLSTKNENYSHQIGPGWGQFLFHSNASGSLSVGWANNSKNRVNITSVFSDTTKWNHIALVIDGNKMHIYVNGKRKTTITSDTYSGLPAFGNLEFGHSGDNQWWNGGLDEIRIWGKALTANEISSNMYTPIEKPSFHPDLLVYLSMDTIQVNGKTMLREWVGGKHASIHVTGPCQIKEEAGPLTTTTSTKPSLKIVDESSTHLASIPFSLTAQSSLNATSWKWSVPGTDIPEFNGVNPTYTFPEAGKYTISCTALFASGDTLTATKEVTIVDGKAPVAAFEILNDTLPAGDRFSFINHSEGDGCTYTWNIPGAEVEQVGGTNASALYPQIGTYPVTLIVNSPFGIDSVTQYVNVQASAPVARFDISRTSIILGDTIQLINESRYSPTSWQWELKNGSRALLIDGESPFIVPVAPGIYDINLKVENELGSNTFTRNRYLVVSNDDPGTCLNFTGNENLQLTCPFSEPQSALTLDWWMHPMQYQGCMNLSSTKGDFSTSVDFKGALTITQGTEKATSDDKFIICNEWHHYAIVFNEGNVEFYRDAMLVSTSSTKLGSSIPALETITVGEEFNKLRGQIDEVRLWGTALSEEKIAGYANRHIDDIQAAQNNDMLLLYYDFNQSGGNVIDRTASACHAQRIGFGPDGDAWNSALGVFTLDLEAPLHGDVSSKYLTNYKNPFITTSGTVNTNNSERFLRLAMRTTKSKWTEINAIKDGDITTGAHIDTHHKSDITFETYWNGFATPLLDYRLWQTVTLPAGNYTFSVTFGDDSNAQESRLVVSSGKTMVSEKRCEANAIAWCKLVDGSLSFTLEEEKQVSLGIIVNMTGQASFNISSFKLEGITTETLTPVNPTGIDDITPEKPAYKGIYNTSGWRLQEIQKGINIIDGKKILNK